MIVEYWPMSNKYSQISIKVNKARNIMLPGPMPGGNFYAQNTFHFSESIIRI